MVEQLAGIGVSRGVVAGPAVRMAERPDFREALHSPAAGTAEQAVDEALAALERVAVALESRLAPTDAASAVLRAQATMARDSAVAAAIKKAAAGGASASQAVAASFATLRSALLAAGAYMAERVADLDDLRDRALCELLGLAMPGIPQPGHSFVLVATDLSPADTALLNPAVVLAIVTEQGGPTSHTAILAKSLGIPAIVAVAGAAELTDGETVLVDGTSGLVQRSPSAATVRTALTEHRAAVARDLATSGPGRTSSGTPVKLLVNIGAERDLETAIATDAEGIGLFRTEFLFLDRTSAPTIQEQVTCYRKVFEAFAGRRVVVRTLDAGADKPLQFVTQAEEPNPALGVRGLRTARSEPGLLDDQLRAIAAAARHAQTEVWVMAPMVSLPSEACDFVAAARAHGISAVGSMIEVPAAALRAHHLLGECDFVSLGTNDLAQYTFAADRMLGELGDLLDPWQPALLELVRLTADAGRQLGKPVGVCGEAASDPLLALVLVGLGVRSLSMAASALPAVRTALRNHTDEDCRAMAEHALLAESAGAGRRAVQQLAERRMQGAGAK